MRDAARHLPQRPQALLLHHRVLGLAQIFICLLQCRVYLRLVRGQRDFASREAYTTFVRGVVAKQNAGRRTRLAEEVAALRALPCRRLEALERRRVKVGPGSTIRVLNNVYSVPARLRGEWVEVWVGAEQIEVRYGQQVMLVVPRLCGQDKHHIDYRHIISWLVRKPRKSQHQR